MRPDLIVVATPVLNDDPGLKAVVEPFHRRTFIAELPVETFIGTVLPWFAGFDQDRFQFFVNRPLQQLRTDELRTIVCAECLSAKQGDSHP